MGLAITSIDAGCPKSCIARKHMLTHFLKGLKQ